MNAFPSGGGGHGALHLVPDGCSVGVSEFLAPAASAGPNKRKRRPAGTPDPDAEVVALSPKTLMESDRYVCEICNQGFQRDQNLQMHRRRHKVPWKLLKRPSLGTNKRVYICPERSCLHHDPAHALGDLVGIKKHYRRKHCTEKQWKCDKCSKGYAVQSDYKAHLKTCGTRGHCCDCGRVFSRVESFIEHQDTCSAVKRKATQSSGGGSGRLKSSIPHHATDRNSTESPSQSSDTTQAMSFAQSGMSDTAARSVDINTSKVLDEHSRRIQESQAAIPSAAMPAWHTEWRNELELLPSMQRVPTDRAHSDHFLLQEVRARVDQASHGSRSQVTRCSSTINHPYPEVTCPELKVILEPSLQLTIGPACGAEVASSSPSSYTDIKPSSSNFTVEREPLALTYHQKQFPTVGIIERLENSSRPAIVEFDGLALPIPATLAHSGNQTMEGRPAGSDHAVSLSDFLMQATRRPPGPALQVESSHAGLHQSTKKDENKNRTEMVSNYNPTCAGSTSSYHEYRTGNMHESDPATGKRATRRGFTNSQLEPATSSVITSRQALNLDVAETDHLFAANSKSVDEAFRSQKQFMAAAARAKTDQACEQTQTDMNATWSDLARVRRTTDEARQECDEAQRELARAEILRREAREQLQFASAEKAYADSAREAAKRQIEISEAELANAKRLREHSQAEVEKAGSQEFSQPTYCHSCNSAIETIPSRRSTPTSPGSWSMMTPSTSIEQNLEAGTRRSTGAGQILFMNSGSSLKELGAKHGADQAMDSNKLYSANRMSWSESIRTPMSGFNHSGDPWSSGYRSTISTLATSMAIGDSPPSGGNPLVAVRKSKVLSPAQSDRRDQIIPKDFDLN